jgi:hypothetical protein
MAPLDWRNAADYAELARLDLSSLAWEFLRRNPQYQLEHAGRELTMSGPEPREVSARWGLRFPVPPRLTAEQAPLFWRAEVAPAHVVILAPSSLGGVTGVDLADFSTARRVAEEGVHLRLSGGLQLIVPAAAGLQTPLAAEAALDADLAIRLTALDAVERLLNGRAAGSDPLSAQARKRAGLLLRALDGRAEGASYRDIAEHVLAARIDPGTWRTSPVRDVAIRLCRTARRLMGGGYRRLLRRRR